MPIRLLAYPSWTPDRHDPPPPRSPPPPSPTTGFRPRKLFIGRQCNCLFSPRLGTLPEFPLPHRSRGPPPPVPTTHQLPLCPLPSLERTVAVLTVGYPEGIGGLKLQEKVRCAATGRTNSILLRQLSDISCHPLQFAPSRFLMSIWHLMTWSGQRALAAILQYPSPNAFSGAVSRPVRNQELQNPARPAASILMINMPLTQ